jgi:hypothetical protein
MTYYTISIRQPWAWAILHAGKDVENRTWPLPKKFIGVKVLIHAGKQVEHEAVIHLLHLGIPVPELLETGGIVGMTVFTGCGTDSGNRPWAEPGLHHWAISTDHTKPLPFLPTPGRLGFFEVFYPYEV